MTGQERGPAPPLSRAETTAVLGEVLRRVRGADARLVDWTAERLKHGRHPVVRYDLRVTLGGGGDTRRDSWVGKFYRHDEAARRVADLVAALAPTGLRARGGVVIPAVLAYHPPHRVLFSVYERGQALAAAILQFGGRVVATLGRAVAAFHATPLHVATRITPQAVLDDLRSRIARGDDRVAAAWGSRPRAPAVATERRRDARPRPLRARRPGAGPGQPARAVAPHRPAAAGGSAGFRSGAGGIAHELPAVWRARSRIARPRCLVRARDAAPQDSLAPDRHDAAPRTRGAATAAGGGGSPPVDGDLTWHTRQRHDSGTCSSPTCAR